MPQLTQFTGGGAPSPRLGSPSSDQAGADAADPQAAIGDLAGLVAGSLGLSELLAEVATFAVHAIPGADGAGVTLLRVDRIDNMVEALAASAPFVAEIDDLQYVTLHEGPCITAALERRTVRSGSLGGEKMWPRFGPRVGRLGVHSALSLPLLLPDQVVGAINVYARNKDVFDEHAAELGELFAKPAAVAVHNAHLLAQAMALAAQLQTALSTRPVIDQAIGLLRGRTGRSAEDAFAQLRAISQAEHRKLAEVAQRIVDEAVRRARAATSRPKSPSPGRVSSRGVARTVDSGGTLPGAALTHILDPPPGTATRPAWPWQARSAPGSAQRSTSWRSPRRWAPLWPS